MMTCQNQINVLFDVYPNWLTDGGIFTDLSQYTSVPWKNSENIDAFALDLDYYGNRSGLRYISKIIQKMLTENGLSTENRKNLCKIIYNRYGLAWNKQYNALLSEYAPLDNYNMIETEESNNTRTPDLQNNQTITDTGSVSQNVTDNDRKSMTEVEVSAFNANNFTDSDKSTTTLSGGTTSETSFNNRKNSKISSETGTEKTETNRKLTRKGNIGVTTSQQMLQSELDLRMFDFFEHVFECVDNVLTIEAYGEESDKFYYNNTGSTYTLPIASPTLLGGVMPLAKSDEMTEPVGVDAIGRLYTKHIEPQTKGIEHVTIPFEQLHLTSGFCYYYNNSPQYRINNLYKGSSCELDLTDFIGKRIMILPRGVSSNNHSKYNTNTVYDVFRYVLASKSIQEVLPTYSGLGDLDILADISNPYLSEAYGYTLSQVFTPQIFEVTETFKWYILTIIREGTTSKAWYLDNFEIDKSKFPFQFDIDIFVLN